jgi:hypothetical protein
VREFSPQSALAAAKAEFIRSSKQAAEATAI